MYLLYTICIHKSSYFSLNEKIFFSVKKAAVECIIIDQNERSTNLNIKKRESSQKSDWKNSAAFIICVSAFVAAAYLLLKYALPIFLPFIIAWALALVTDPLAAKISQRLKLPKKVCSALTTSLVIALFFILVTLGISRLISEAQRLLERLAADSARLGSTVAELFDRFTSIGDKKIPLIENLMNIEQFREVWENIDKLTSEAISEAVSSLTRGIPVAAVNVIGSMPSIILFTVITLVSCFYFALDLDRIHAALFSLLPQKWQDAIPSVKKRICGTAAKYLRAYVLLLFLTFCQLFVGFLILDVKYPLLIALLVALVDILPILGVGTVLIPWGIIELVITKDIYTGLGLFIIYIVVTVIRQITEPKVVAGSLGLHPLLTLVSMYAGLRLFGIFGMIIGPAAVLAIRSVIKKPVTDG